MLTLDELVAALPQGNVGGPSHNAKGLSLPSRDQWFVEPPLEPEARDTGSSSAIIISASAAVGKTTLAKEIAARTGNLYLDLQKYAVGNYLLQGTLYEECGPNVYPAIERRDAAIVLDSLDEALVADGERAYEEFVSDVGRLLGKSPSGPAAVVMLGRPYTAELTRLLLNEHGVKDVRFIQLMYFDQPGAKQFVLRRIARKDAVMAQRGEPSKTPFDGNRQAYGRAVEDIIRRLEAFLRISSPWSDPRGRSFMGYSQVLAAIGDFLQGAESPEALQTASTTIGAAETVSEDGFLRLSAFVEEQIILSLMLRERDKLKDDFQHQDLGGIPDDYFAPAMQTQLLTKSNIRDAVRPPEGMEPEDQPAAAGLVRSRIAEHPLLDDDLKPLASRFVSPVFRDFAFAKALLSDESSAELVIAATGSSGFQASPMLAGFVVNQLLRERHPLPVDRFPPVYESLLGGDLPPRLAIVSMPDDSDAAIATLTWQRDHADAAQDDAVTSFRLVGLDEAPIVFRRQVKNIELDVPVAYVQFGSGAGEHIWIGPDVSVVAAAVSISAAERVIDRAGPTSLIADEIDDSSQAPLRFVPTADEPHSPLVDAACFFPWSQYVAGRVDPDPEIADAAKEFRNLTRWPTAMGSGLRFGKQTLDANHRKRHISDEFMEYAKTTELLVLDGQFYRLDMSVASADLGAIKTLQFGEETLAFLRKYVTWRNTRADRKGAKA